MIFGIFHSLDEYNQLDGTSTPMIRYGMGGHLLDVGISPCNSLSFSVGSKISYWNQSWAHSVSYFTNKESTPHNETRQKG